MPSARDCTIRLVCGFALSMYGLGCVAQEADAAADAPAPAAGADAAVEAETPDEAAPPVTRFELQIQAEELVSAEDFAAAAALTEKLLALSEEEFGPESPMLADAYVEAASIRMRNKEYEAAEEYALRAIEIYRDANGPFARELIDPFLVLGDTYEASEDYLRALTAFSEARTISRRIYGLLDPGQIDIIDRMTESALDLNDFTQAQNLQLEALTLVARTHEPYSKEVIDATLKYGRWLRARNLFTAERDQYFRLDRILREHYGEGAVELVPVLLARANSFRTQGVEESFGIGGLNEALDILAATPDADPLLRAQALRDFGDWQTAFSRVPPDGEAYRESWQLLGRVENGGDLRREWYERATIVLGGELSRRGLSFDPQDPRGNVLVHFTVDTQGRTSNVVIVESNPPGLKDEAVERLIRQSRFRPMVRGGELVPSNRAYNIQFRYAADKDEKD